MRFHLLLAVLLMPALAVSAGEPRPGKTPITTVGRDHAVKIALAHLNIDKVTKEPSEAFNLRVMEHRMTQKELKMMDEPGFGQIRHKDVAGLPESFEIFYVTIQHGRAGDSAVYVTKKGGRVILVRFMPEG